MDETQRSKIFQKLGFWEADIEKITLSCGKCNEAVSAKDCEQKESKITNSRVHTVRLQLLCPKCKTPVAGADI